MQLYFNRCIKITADRKSENAKIVSVTNLVNKTNATSQRSIYNNDILSILLGKLISESEQGKPPNKLALSFLLNKSMETTKADPYAEPNTHDPLKEMAQFIIKTDMLPTKNPRLNTILLKCYQDEHLGSSRRANRSMYKSDEYYAHKILSSKGFMDLDLLIPSDEAIQEEKKKRSRERKTKFNKRRVEK